MKKKIVLFLIKLFGLERSKIGVYENLMHGGKDILIELTEYDIVTFPEMKLRRIKRLVEDLQSELGSTQ